jgi:hypothetical protein
MTRAMCDSDSRGLSQLLDKRILRVGDNHFLGLEMRGECDDFSTIWSKSATLILQR